MHGNPNQRHKLVYHTLLVGIQVLNHQNQPSLIFISYPNFSFATKFGLLQATNPFIPSIEFTG